MSRFETNYLDRRHIEDTIDTKQEVLLMHFTISHTTSLLCVAYLDDLSQIVTNIREIILQTTRVFFRRAWWKEVALFRYLMVEM